MSKKHHFSLYPKKQKVKKLKKEVEPTQEQNEIEDYSDDDFRLLEIYDDMAVLEERNERKARIKRSVEFLKPLEPAIKCRLRALNQLQLIATKIDLEFQKEIIALQRKYTKKKYSEVYEKCAKIIQGLYEPTDEEATWKTSRYNCAAISEVLQTDNVDKNQPSTSRKSNDKIRGFWLRVLVNSIHSINTLRKIIEPVRKIDLPALRHLIDIKVIFLENPLAFEIEFHFEPNDFFEDKVLKRTYNYVCRPKFKKESFVASMDLYFLKTHGQVIKWKPDKNLCKKNITLRKRTFDGTIRTMCKEVDNNSFFKYFDPVKNSCFDTVWGQYMYDILIPNSVFIYLGINQHRQDSPNRRLVKRIKQIKLKLNLN